MAAPPVTVPMNFGRHHIGSKTHSNMTLRLKSGGEMKVSSLILSFNSPVIQRLIAGLEITSLDVDEFEDSAVRCFVDCAYTGGIELLDKKVFRDVTKMAYVYEVEWLVGRCQGYFCDNLSMYPQSEFSKSIPNLVKVVSALDTTMNRTTFWNFLIEATDYYGLLDNLLSHYVATFIWGEDTCEKFCPSKLDLLIRIAGKQHDKLLKLITLDIHKSQTLTESSKYLLQKLDLRQCMKVRKKMCCDLFTILIELDSVSREDLKMVSNLQLNALKSVDIMQTTSYNPANQKLLVGVKVRPFVGYLFQPLELVETDDFFDFHAEVSNKTAVINLYMYADYLFTYLERRKDAIQAWSEDWTKAICELKSMRKWKALNKGYLNSWGLSDKVLKLLVNDENFIKSIVDVDETKLWTSSTDWCDNKTHICVDKIVSTVNRTSLVSFSRKLELGKRSRFDISNISVEMKPTAMDDLSIQIGYSVEIHTSGKTQIDDLGVNIYDFYLTVSKMCYIAENCSKYDVQFDKELPVSRKTGLCKLVKRPDIFGGGDVWKVQGHDIVLDKGTCLTVELYG